MRNRLLCGINLLYAPLTIPLVYCHINDFQRASRLARPCQGGDKMTAMWASHHEALCSAGVVAPHVHTHMVAPHRWGVLDGGNPLGSAVDASRRPSMGHPLPHSFEFITVYGLWYAVPPLKGGATYGQCTICRSASSLHGVPGFHQPDPRRVSAVGAALRGRLPSPYGGMVPRWQTPDRPPV